MKQVFEVSVSRRANGSQT